MCPRANSTARRTTATDRKNSDTAMDIGTNHRPMISIGRSDAAYVKIEKSAEVFPASPGRRWPGGPLPDASRHSLPEGDWSLDIFCRLFSIGPELQAHARDRL